MIGGDAGWSLWHTYLQTSEKSQPRYLFPCLSSLDRDTMIPVSQDKAGTTCRCPNSLQLKYDFSRPVAIIQNIWLLKEANCNVQAFWRVWKIDLPIVWSKQNLALGYYSCCSQGGNWGRHGLCGQFKLTQRRGKMVLELRSCCPLWAWTGAGMSGVWASATALLCDGRLEGVFFLLSFSLGGYGQSLGSCRNLQPSPGNSFNF